MIEQSDEGRVGYMVLFDRRGMPRETVPVTVKTVGIVWATAMADNGRLWMVDRASGIVPDEGGFRGHPRFSFDENDAALMGERVALERMISERGAMSWRLRLHALSLTELSILAELLRKATPTPRS